MEERHNIETVISILRESTRIAKIAPFAFVFVYMLIMVCYMLFSDNVAVILDTLFYVSPMTVVLLWLLSRAFKLCNWHRFECVLSLIPQIPIFFDDYINQFGYVATFVNISVIGLLFLLSLINAYFVFIKK